MRERALERNDLSVVKRCYVTDRAGSGAFMSALAYQKDRDTPH